MPPESPDHIFSQLDNADTDPARMQFFISKKLVEKIFGAKKVYVVD
jgi:hypothetical protein